MQTKPRTKVCYFGEKICVYELCEMAGVQVKTFLKRWREIGKPDDISLIGGLLSRHSKSNPSTLTVIDGQKEMVMTIKTAAMVFGTSQYTVRKRISKYGRKILIANMRVRESLQKSGKANKNTSVEWKSMGAKRRKEPPQPVDTSRGWAERKYFPATGSAGFSKAARSGVNAHCDRCTILPILNGD